MTHLLIVGRKFSSLTTYLEHHGYEHTHLQDIRLTKHPEKRLKHRIVADFSDDEKVLASLDQLKSKIDGVITTYENYVHIAARIAAHLNVPGMPITAAAACTDKNLMRQLFSKAPYQISPDFQLVNSERDLIEFSQQHTFPLILKPTNLAKSLLVTKSNNLDELRYNYQHSVDLLGSTYRKYAPHKDPQLLIEEYLEGTIHSVDAFIDNQGVPTVLEQVVDYETGYNIGYDDNFHYSRILPSALTRAEQAALRNCAAAGIKALGMKNSAAHVEVIMTKSGPRIVEIGARNGGYRERMHNLANGIDIIGANIATVLGKEPRVEATRNDCVAVLEIFPREMGIFKGLKNEKMLRNLTSLNYISIKAQLDDTVGKSSDGYKAVAIIILHNQDAAQFEKDLQFVRENVFVEIH